MDEYEIDYLMALAEVMCDMDTSPKINGYRWEGVRQLFAIIRAYQTTHVRNELLKAVWEKKLAKVTSATTKGEIEAVLEPSSPILNGDGDVIGQSPHHVEEEELILWSLITPNTNMTYAARKRYIELFRKLFPEQSEKFGV